MTLQHFGMDVEAAVAQLCDLLGQQLYSIDAVAEDDGLVDAQLAEQRVEAVHLLALFYKGVVLRYTLKRELIHEVDNVGLAQELLLELLDCDWEGSTEQHDLTVLWQEGYQLLDKWLKLRR